MTFLARAPFSNLRSSLLSVHFWLPEGAKCDSAICLTETLTVASENVNGVLFRVRDLSIVEIAEARLEPLFGGWGVRIERTPRKKYSWRLHSSLPSNRVWGRDSHWEKDLIGRELRTGKGSRKGGNFVIVSLDPRSLSSWPNSKLSLAWEIAAQEGKFSLDWKLTTESFPIENFVVLVLARRLFAIPFSWFVSVSFFRWLLINSVTAKLC